MKIVESFVARRIKVVANANKVAWATIKDADSGEVLHVGKPKYIRETARKRYNVIARV